MFYDFCITDNQKIVYKALIELSKTSHFIAIQAYFTGSGNSFAPIAFNHSALSTFCTSLTPFLPTASQWVLLDSPKLPLKAEHHAALTDHTRTNAPSASNRNVL